MVPTMADKRITPAEPKAHEARGRKPFNQPSVEALGKLTVVTQQTIIIEP